MHILFIKMIFFAIFYLLNNIAHIFSNKYRIKYIVFKDIQLFKNSNQ